MAGLVSVGLLLFGVGAFVIVQRRGMFGWILNLLRRIGLRIQFLEAREQQLIELIVPSLALFPSTTSLLLSTGLFLLAGWRKRWRSMVMCCAWGNPSTSCRLSRLGALSVFIKGGTFLFGQFGAQDAGNLFLLSAFAMAKSRALPSRSAALSGICLDRAGAWLPGDRDQRFRSSFLRNNLHAS